MIIQVTEGLNETWIIKDKIKIYNTQHSDANTFVISLKEEHISTDKKAIETTLQIVQLYNELSCTNKAVLCLQGDHFVCLTIGCLILRKVYCISGYDALNLIDYNLDKKYTNIVRRISYKDLIEKKRKLFS